MLKRTLMILALTLSIFSTASAEEFMIEADGYHTLSRKETILEAEEAAVNDALRWAVEQIGVRISAYSEVVNKVLKEDTVQRFASSVVKIKEKTLTPKVMNDDYRIYAHVVCVVNTDDLDRWEPPDVERQRRLEEDKKRLEQEREDTKWDKLYLAAQIVSEERNTSAMAQMSYRQKIKTTKGDLVTASKLLKKADALLREGKIREAAEEYVHAWNANPKNAIPIYRVAAIAWNNHNYRKFIDIVTVSEYCENNDWYYEIGKWVDKYDRRREDAPGDIDLVQYISDTTTTVPRKGHGL